MKFRNIRLWKVTNRIHLLASFVFIVILCSSCVTSSRAIYSLRDLCDDMERYGDTYTQQDVYEAARDYERITDRMARYDYSSEEIQEINRLKGRYTAVMAKIQARQLKDGVVNTVKEATSVFEGIIEGIKGGNKK